VKVKTIESWKKKKINRNLRTENLKWISENKKNLSEKQKHTIKGLKRI
jgi:hypothetical protein